MLTLLSAHPSSRTSLPALARIPSAAALPISNPVSVPSRAESRTVPPIIDPSRIDAVVDLDISDTSDATGAGSKVGPEEECVVGITSLVEVIEVAGGGSSSAAALAVNDIPISR